MNVRFNIKMVPPEGTSDVFVGCRRANSPYFQAGIIGRVPDIFQQEVFRRKSVTNAAMGKTNIIKTILHDNAGFVLMRI